MPTARTIKRLRIAGNGQRSSILDYRSFTPPNGGRIPLLACVHHIPVIRQMPGRQDLDAMRGILQRQGLMVQFGTDASGHIALYTRANRLCYHARGANSTTCGIEHMHLTTGEWWSRKQLRAAGWIANYLRREFGVPLQSAQIEPGGRGVARVVRKGHTTHERISAAAGYHDRSDPGRGFDQEYVFHAARFFARHGHFVGA